MTNEQSRRMKMNRLTANAANIGNPRKGKSRLDRWRKELAEASGSQEYIEGLKAKIASIEWGMRYIEFLRAGLPEEVQDAVVYNIISWQWKEGMLRTDRHFKHYGKDEKVAPSLFKANAEAISANSSDAKVFEQLGEFKEENSLDMCEDGEKWFRYVVGKPAQADDLPF